MEGLAALIPFIVIFSIISAVVRAAKQSAAKGNTQGTRPGMPGANRTYTGVQDQRSAQMSSARSNGASTPNGPQMTVEQELAAIRERAIAKLNARISAAREQAEYRAPRTNAVPEKPIIAHSTSDCTGGSIHDGYHEGTIRRPAPASSPEGVQGLNGARRGSYYSGSGSQGVQGTEGTPLSSVTPPKSRPAAAADAPKQPAESGAERLSKSISGQSGIVQGIIWSEVLGSPKADQI